MAWFLRTTRHLDRVLVWIGAFGTVWAGMTWLSTKLTRFGDVGTPEAVFIGLGAAVLLTIALSLALIGWRIFKPIAPSGPAVGGNTLEHDALEKLQADVRELETDFRLAVGITADWHEGTQKELAALDRPPPSGPV